MALTVRDTTAARRRTVRLLLLKAISTAGLAAAAVPVVPEAMACVQKILETPLLALAPPELVESGASVPSLEKTYITLAAVAEDLRTTVILIRVRQFPAVKVAEGKARAPRRILRSIPAATESTGLAAAAAAAGDLPQRLPPEEMAAMDW